MWKLKATYIPWDLQVPVFTTCNIIRKCGTEAKRGNLIEDSSERLLDCWRERLHQLLRRFKLQTQHVGFNRYQILLKTGAEAQIHSGIIFLKLKNWKSFSSASTLPSRCREKSCFQGQVSGTDTMLTWLKKGKLPRQVKQVRAEQCSKTHFNITTTWNRRRK